MVTEHRPPASHSGSACDPRVTAGIRVPQLPSTKWEQHVTLNNRAAVEPGTWSSPTCVSTAMSAICLMGSSGCRLALVLHADLLSLHVTKSQIPDLHGAGHSASGSSSTEDKTALTGGTGRLQAAPRAPGWAFHLQGSWPLDFPTQLPLFN